MYKVWGRKYELYRDLQSKTPELDYGSKVSLGKLTKYTPSQNGYLFMQFHSETRDTRVRIIQGGVAVSGIAGVNRSEAICHPVSKGLDVTIVYENNPEFVTLYFVPYK